MDAPYPEIKRQSPKLNEETSHQQKPTTSTKLQPEFTRTFKDYIDAELRAAIKRLNPPHEPYPGDSNSVPNLANNKTKDEYRHGSNPKPELKGTKKSNDLLAEAGCLRPGLRPELKRRTSSRSTSPNLLTLDQIFEKFQGSASNSDQDEPTECSSCNADSSYITVDKTAALGVENASEVSCYVDALSHLSVHPAGAKPYRSLAKYTYNTPDEGKKPKERGSSMKIIRTKTKSSRRKDAERNTESSHAQEERADTAKPARLRSSRNKPKRKGDSTPSAMEPRPHKEINTTVRAVSINSSNTSNTFINNDCNYTDYQPSCESVCDSELATTRDNKEHTCGWKLDFENTTVTPSVPTSPRYHPSVSSTRYTKSGDKEDKVNSNVPKAAASINHNVSVWEYLEKDDTARASRGVKLSSGKGLLNKNGIHMG